MLRNTTKNEKKNYVEITAEGDVRSKLCNLIKS